MFNYKNSDDLPFIDFLWNILIVMISSIMLLLLLKSIETEGAPQPEPYMVILTWDDESKDDIDLWIENDKGPYCSFTSREKGFMFLDKDDLGQSSDKVIIDGLEIIKKQNREVITLKDIIPDSTYSVNVHMFYKKDQVLTKGKVEFYRVKPFSLLYSKEFEFEQTGELAFGLNMIFDGDKMLTNITTDENYFVYNYLTFRSSQGLFE